MKMRDFFATNSLGEAVVRSDLGSDVWEPSTPAQEYREEQARQLTRVSGALAGKIRGFLGTVLAKPDKFPGGRFFASQLHAFVGGAPASADRVLRSMRQAGEVGVEVVDRSRSMYRVARVELAP